jgi:ketosteroid isomerase-like protein
MVTREARSDMASAAARGSPRATLGQMIKLLQDKDLDALADLYAPRRIEGREQVRAYFTGTLAGVALEFQRFEEVAIHDTTDPNVIVAEYDAHGVIPSTGRRFTVRNIWVLNIVDGRIGSWRDYWNPLEIIQLQGLLPNLLTGLTQGESS